MAGGLIFIVEDNERNRKLVRDVLFTGYQTIEVETREDSLHLARDRRPNLILMEIRLTGINGIEALKRLRADPATRAIPVMAMTASIMTAGPEEMRAAGFDGYQLKGERRQATGRPSWKYQRSQSSIRAQKIAGSIREWPSSSGGGRRVLRGGGGEARRWRGDLDAITRMTAFTPLRPLWRARDDR